MPSHTPRERRRRKTIEGASQSKSELFLSDNQGRRKLKNITIRRDVEFDRTRSFTKPSQTGASMTGSEVMKLLKQDLALQGPSTTVVPPGRRGFDIISDAEERIRMAAARNREKKRKQRKKNRRR